MSLEASFVGVHCTLKRRRPCPGLVLLTLVGVDAGELGRAPFVALEQDFADGPVEFFIDARHARSASIDVSGHWAVFFRAHRDRIDRVHMLVRSRFIRMSAELVRSFAALDDRMEIVTDSAEFERTFGARVIAS